MAKYTILSEQQIEVYHTPGLRIKQQVITYQAEGLAPRTLWLDTDKLPDSAWQLKNPGKPVPADLLALGDALRKVAFEADVARISKAAPPRTV